MGVACTSASSSGDSARPQEIAYADLVPLFEERCGGCHLNGFASGGFSFDGGAADLVGIESRMGMVYAEPGSTDGSYLWHKVAGTHVEAGGFGARMPIGVPLDDRELQQVESWIAAGCTP